MGSALNPAQVDGSKGRQGICITPTDEIMVRQKEYIVSGSGYTDCDGRYSATEKLLHPTILDPTAGQMIYNKDGIYHYDRSRLNRNMVDGGIWEIVDSGNTRRYETSETNLTSPELGSWISTIGDDPPPTVTAEIKMIGGLPIFSLRQTLTGYKRHLSLLINQGGSTTRDPEIVYVVNDPYPAGVLQMTRDNPGFYFFRIVDDQYLWSYDACGLSVIGSQSNIRGTNPFFAHFMRIDKNYMALLVRDKNYNEADIESVTDQPLKIDIFSNQYP